MRSWICDSSGHRSSKGAAARTLSRCLTAQERVSKPKECARCRSASSIAGLLRHSSSDRARSRSGSFGNPSMICLHKVRYTKDSPNRRADGFAVAETVNSPNLAHGQRQHHTKHSPSRCKGDGADGFAIRRGSELTESCSRTATTPRRLASSAQWAGSGQQKPAVSVGRDSGKSRLSLGPRGRGI